MRHAGDGRHEGPDTERQGAQVAAQRDGIPADQPSAGLPDLRPGRRVRTAGPVAGLRPFGLALLRAQARGGRRGHGPAGRPRSDEHTSELQSLMRTSYAVFCLKKKIRTKITNNTY